MRRTFADAALAAGFAASLQVTAPTARPAAGQLIDLVAPGGSIYSTVRGGTYASSSGTSFRSPTVAGVYALMISANPTLQPSQLDSILFSTATDIGAAGKDEKSGWGVVNASAALAKAMNTVATDSSAPTAAIATPTASAKLSRLASVDVSVTDNIAVTRTGLYVNGALYATDTGAPVAFSLDTTKFNDGSATLLAKAFDAAGNAGTSAPVAVTIGNDTVPPVVTIQSHGGDCVAVQPRLTPTLRTRRAEQVPSASSMDATPERDAAPG